jgi:hypothetical protein
MKMYVYVRDWGLYPKRNQLFILSWFLFSAHVSTYAHGTTGTMKQMIYCCFATVRNNGLSKVAKNHSGHVSVQYQDIIWCVT